MPIDDILNGIKKRCIRLKKPLDIVHKFKDFEKCCADCAIIFQSEYAAGLRCPVCDERVWKKEQQELKQHSKLLRKDGNN